MGRQGWNLGPSAFSGWAHEDSARGARSSEHAQGSQKLPGMTQGALLFGTLPCCLDRASETDASGMSESLAEHLMGSLGSASSHPGAAKGCHR